MPNYNQLSARRLRVTLTLVDTNTKFPGTNSSTLVLSDMRTSAMVKATAKLATECEVRIYGMRAADMDALTVAWANPPVVRKNTIVVEAAVGTSWVTVFGGTIKEAQPDYTDAPNVSFVVSAMTGYYERISSAPATSYTQPVPIADVVRYLADKMGFTVADGNTNAVLSDQYLWGTYYEQLRQACAAAKVDFYLFNQTITITPAGLPFTQQPAVLLTPQSGLIGYPQYGWGGLDVAAVFDPAFACAVPVEISGSIPSANGRWYPYSMKHLLDALVPGGNWQTQMQCLRVLA